HSLQAPQGWLAYQLGKDPVDVSAVLADRGIATVVTSGNIEEAHATWSLIHANQRAGCVLDYTAFWLHWRLNTLDTVIAVCGPIPVPQCCIDRWHVRREIFERSAVTGSLSVSYSD